MTPFSATATTREIVGARAIGQILARQLGMGAIWQTTVIWVLPFAIVAPPAVAKATGGPTIEHHPIICGRPRDRI